VLRPLRVNHVDPTISTRGPLYPELRTSAGTTGMSQLCRLCCKSRKLQGSKFFAKTQSGRQSLIRITSFALAKSPMSLTQGDEVPHVLTRKSRLQPAEFLITSAKRLLQHNLPETDMHSASLGRAFQADGRGFSPIEGGLEGGGSVS
jgi:hypothetical protein